MPGIEASCEGHSIMTIKILPALYIKYYCSFIYKTLANSDVGVSRSHLYFLSITLTDPCIQYKLSSECPENLGHLKV